MAYRIILTLLICMNSFACLALNTDEVDDLLVKSTIAIAEGDYAESERILKDLYSQLTVITYSQKVNVLNGLLELNYILNKHEMTDLYARELLGLLEENPKYAKVKSRLIFRLCESEDWIITRDTFKDICSLPKDKSRHNHGHPPVLGPQSSVSGTTMDTHQYLVRNTVDTHWYTGRKALYPKQRNAHSN